MLVELHIENYAVVEKLRVRFHPGLNVLTGETGSGKSIVVDALGLLFGGRVSGDMLRTGSDRARVSGIFEVESAIASPLLEEAGIEMDSEELIIEREIPGAGKSRAFVNSRPVTAALLRDLALALGDIHGQHDQQRLFSPDAQRDMLDDFGNAHGLRGQVAAVYRNLRACAAELVSLERMEQEKLRLLDLWTFQRREIEAAALKSGEDTELEGERRRLQNVGKLMESATAAYAALYDNEASAYAQMRVALRRLEDVSRIDESLSGAVETLRPAEIAVADASATLRDYLGDLEADPARLEEIESRLANIDKLKRKYGGTIDEILAFGEQVRADIQTAESTAERRVALERQRTELEERYGVIARKLTEVRRAAADTLGSRVGVELKALAMDRTRFEIRLSPAAPSEAGSDLIAFYVSANVGEEARPLEKVASGGELSRIALALKTCVTEAGQGFTLVFDEVDAGIGGAAAESVGRRLKALAARSQVLCVTHLAQIAGFADHHYSVEKREMRGRTLAEVQELSGEARTREIGRMLAGQRLTPEALKHAEQLIRLGSE